MPVLSTCSLKLPILPLLSMDIHPIYPKRFVTAYGDLWRIVVIHNSSCNSVATAIGAAGPSGGGHRGNCNKFVEVATLGESVGA